MGSIIALDWGTTQMRAALIDSGGNVLEERVGESGVGDLSAQGFAERFAEVTEGWDADLAVACGMVGSRQGWREAAYVECPALLTGLSDQTVRLETGTCDLFIVPGYRVHRSTGSHDVMRGEETQISGLLSLEPDFAGTVILPGTHSKWVRLADGVVHDFLSFMTGEVFDVLCKQTILSHTIQPNSSTWNDASFKAGLDAAKQSDGLIWSRLFAIRADSLIKGGDEGGQREYLSGMLIGSELITAQASGFKTEKMAIIGGPKLAALYEQACMAYGISARAYKGTDLVWPALTAIGKILQNKKA